MRALTTSRRWWWLVAGAGLALAVLLGGVLGQSARGQAPGPAGAGPDVTGLENGAPLRTQVGRFVPVGVGFNLLAWSGAETPIGEATAGLPGSFTIFRLDSATGRFATFGPDRPGPLNTLTSLRPGDAFWLSAAEASVWTQAARLESQSIGLVAGFNLVPWLGREGLGVAEAIAGLGDSVRAVFTFDVATQQFRSFRPGAPAITNTLRTLRYGDGVFVQMTSAAIWEQASPQLIHTMDAWLITEIVHRDGATGVERDFLPDLLSQIGGSLGAGVPIPGGATLQPTDVLRAVVTDEAGTPMPHIGATVGLLRDGRGPGGVALSSGLSAAEEATASLVIFTTPRVDQTPTNADTDDALVIDWSGIDGVAAGDQLVVRKMFAQFLPPADPLVELGLSPLEVLVQR